MKKAFVRGLIILLVVAVAICAWFSGYYHQKNPDNIPSKALMVTYLKENGEAFASEKIKGYSLDALSSIWGEPDSGLFGVYGEIWTVGNDWFLVYFDSKSQAVSVQLGDST